MATNELMSWGVVPSIIVEVVHRLTAKITKDSRHLGKLDWPDVPGDVSGIVRLAVSDSHKIQRAGNDLRSLLTAYAHRFHEPRPVMADLARAQETSRQGIPRRYSESTVQAIQQLLSDAPNLGVILHGLPSLSLTDLTEFSGPVGDAARSVKSGEVEFVSYAQQQRAARQKKRDNADDALRGLLPKRAKTAHREDEPLPPVDAGAIVDYWKEPSHTDSQAGPRTAR